MFKILISVLLFLLPLFFLPITPEFFETGKLLLFSAFNLCFLILWLVKIVKSKSFSLRASPLDFFVLLYGASFILAIIFSWSGLSKYPALVTTYYVLNLIILYFVIVNQTKETEESFYQWPLSLSGFFLSLLSFMLFFRPKTAYPLTFNLTPGVKFTIPNFSWSPTGGSLITFIYLLVIVSFLLPAFIKRLKENFSVSFLFSFLLILANAAGMFLEAYKTFIIQKPLLLPFSSGWTIAVEGFKPITNFLFGAGPGNFVTAFSRFKPTLFNQSPYWNLRFGTSSNEYLQILSTLGFFGLVSFLFLAMRSLSVSLKKKIYSLPLLLVVFLFLPANTPTLFLFFVFLAILGVKTSQEKYKINVGENNLFYLLPVTGCLVLAILFYGECRSYLAEVYFQKAQIAISQNLGKEAYDLETKALQTNPYNDNYHSSFALLNFILANNLAQKKDLSDQEKQMVTQLLQSSIAEARNAVSLAPKNSLTWENLAQIYRNLINTAQGADQWTVTALRQAISLDPANPRLRVELGGLFYSFKNYESAIDLFKAAVSLKPDFPNGYYNLAYAYKDKEEYQSAVAAMEAVLTLVDKNSNDFKKASSDLEELKKLLPAPSVTPKPVKPETLTLPSPAPTKKPEITPIVLPKPEEATGAAQ